MADPGEVRAVVPDERLAGRRVLVTGASQGLGEAVVRRPAAGVHVLSAAPAAGPVDLPARVIATDLSTAEGVAHLAHRAVEELGGIDVLIDDAGASRAPMPVLEQSDSAWEEDWALDLMAAGRLDSALVPAVVERGSGVVVRISSVASRLTSSSQLRTSRPRPL